MRVKFWGVRGSIPSPGPNTIRYGGNTSCVSLHLDNGKTLVLDAGSGIRELGKSLIGRKEEILVLVTHPHWDHIQGFPFFPPLYEAGRKIWLFPTSAGQSLFCALIEQMDGAHFPVTPDRLPSRCEFVVQGTVEVLAEHGFSLMQIETNHPGGCQGFRVEHAGRSVVYMPDNDLNPVGAVASSFVQLVDFCRGADVLIHDAQYLPEDYPMKRGWGHSQVREACQLAVEAAVGQLVLFHHDPDRTDDEVDRIQTSAQEWMASRPGGVDCLAAREGLEIGL